MKKSITRVILAMNIFIWILLSSINYLGIVRQLSEDIVKVFFWSIFMVIMYIIIIYSLTLQMKRIILLFEYRDFKHKYISNKVFFKQIGFLIVVTLYMYGLCYYNYIFIGLIPIFIFFSNILTYMSRFYVYVHGHLILIEDLTKEYRVLDFNAVDKRLFIIEDTPQSHKLMEITYKMEEEEAQFLTELFTKDSENVPMQSIV